MKRTLILALSFYLASCGGNSEKTYATDEVDQGVSASCLADYVENNEIEKMISAEQLATIIGKSEADLEYEDGKASSAKYSTVRYEWDPDQKRSFTMEVTVGDKTMTQELPLRNGVTFGYLEVLESRDKGPLEYFDFVYGPKTDNEKELAKKSIEHAAEESKEVDSESAEIIKSMVDKQNDTRVDGVGDRAYGSVGKASGLVYYKIKVLHGNTMFEVTADVSDDSAEDIRVAIAVAKQIINNCN